MKYFLQHRKMFFTILFLILIFYHTNAQTPVIDSLKTELKKAKLDTNRVNLLVALSFQIAGRNQHEAINLSREGLHLATKLFMVHGQSRCYNTMGIAYWYSGKYDSAQLMYEESLKLNLVLKDSVGIANGYNNIGLVLWNQGKYASVLSYFLKGLVIFESLEDSTSLISVYNNLGLVYHELGQLENAIYNYSKSWNLNKKLGNPPLTSLLTNIGVAHYNLKQYDLAEDYHLQSLDISVKNKDKNGIAESYSNLGDIYLDKSKYPKALESFLKALEIRKQTVNVKAQISSYYKLGLIYFNLGEIEKSKEMLIISLDIAKKLGNTKDIRNAYLQLAKCAELQYSYKEAFNFHQLFYQYNDSIYNETSSKQIAEMQTRLEVFQKEKEILILNKNKEIQAIELINTQEQVKYQKNINYLGVLFTIIVLVVGVLLFYAYRLKKTSEKNKLQKLNLETENKLLRTQMNPHFIFNSLNSIQNFVLKNEATLATHYIADFATLMRAILDNSKYSFIELGKELETLELYLKLEQIRFDNKFSYQINYDSNLEIDFILVPPMILQPFIENAILHGILNKKEKGNIRIDISDKGDLLYCIIEDDGIGREKAQKIKQNTLHQATHASLGLQLNKERIEVLNKELGTQGKIIITDLYNKQAPIGTKVEVLLPIKN